MQMLKKSLGRRVLSCCDLGQGQVAGFCEHGNETGGSMKCGNVDLLRNCQLPKGLWYMELYSRLHGVIYRKTQKYWSVAIGQLSQRTMSKSRLRRVFVSVCTMKIRRRHARPGLANPWHAAFTAVPIFVFPLPDQHLHIVKSMYIYTHILLRTDCK